MNLISFCHRGDRHGGCGGVGKVPTLTYENLKFCVLLCLRKCRKEPSPVAGRQLSAKQLGNLNSMCSKVTFRSLVSAVHLLLSTLPSGFVSHPLSFPISKMETLVGPKPWVLWIKRNNVCNVFRFEDQRMQAPVLITVLITLIILTSDLSPRGCSRCCHFDGTCTPIPLATVFLLSARLQEVSIGFPVSISPSPSFPGSGNFTFLSALNLPL